MSQSQSTVLNGPEGEITMAFAQESNISTAGIGANPQQFIRPQLQRLDSRASLQPRPPFPTQPGQQPFRPPLQTRPPFPSNPQLQANSPFVQRPPGTPGLQRPPQFQPPLNIRPGIPNPAARPPIPRAATAAAPPRPPILITQKSVPASPRSQLNDEILQRSKTLDTTETPVLERFENGAKPAEEKPAVNTMKPRSFSLAGNSELPQVENRRVSVSSVGSTEEIPSRPESRASAHMQKIEENVVADDKTVPPSTLPLNKSDSKQSSSPSPQPESVIESKPKKTERLATPEPQKTSLAFVKSNSPVKKEGDHDSGVDESTQGNDNSSNGETKSPRKSARNTSRLTTPTKNRSFSRGSRSPNLKSPDSTPSTPGTTEKKKIPMNKVQVGSAPSPNLKVVKSKIGSLANANYKPGGGNVKIEHKKIDLSHAHSKIGTKNEAYMPTGGDKKIQSQKLQWNATSKIGSLDNAAHKPKGGDKKIETVKLDFKDKAKPKVGSKDNMKHQPGGGDVKIENKKIELKVQSKVGSMDNVKHKPGGGEVKIFDDKDYLRQMSATMTNDNVSVSGSQKKKVTITERAVSPTEARIMEALQERAKTPDVSRPASRLSRSNSLRKKKKAEETPRTPWRI